MTFLRYLRCIATGKHSYVKSVEKPGYETCVECRHRREDAGIDVTHGLHR